MGYSLEYKEWTGENVDAEFSIAEASSTIGPDMEKELICDGIGFVALLKGSDGQLLIKLKPVDGEPSEIVSYFDILTKFKAHNPISPTV
jgi:hypothetical protein